MTYQIVYSSESTMPMQSDGLREILDQARINNSKQGITGALVYAEGIFLQILEGDREKIDALMAKIRGDLRHQAVTVLQEGEASAARFGSWNMAYVGATREQVSRWAGLTDAIPEMAASDDQDAQDLKRTERFAQEILSLLVMEEGVDGAA